MKMSKNFLKEVERFDSCGRSPGSPQRTELGIQQFYEWESHGKMPEKPDRYFTHLWDGKAWWEWTLNEIAKTYLTQDWVGWYQYAKDFIDDPRGFYQLRQRLYQEPIDPIDLIIKVDWDLSIEEKRYYWQGMPILLKILDAMLP